MLQPALNAMVSGSQATLSEAIGEGTHGLMDEKNTRYLFIFWFMDSLAQGHTGCVWKVIPMPEVPASWLKNESAQARRLPWKDSPSLTSLQVLKKSVCRGSSGSEPHG